MGELHVLLDNGQRIPVDGYARRAALGHLAAIAPSVARVDALIDTLWPGGDPPPTHRAALRNTVTWLRRRLSDGHDGGPDPIAHQNNGYRLHPSIEIDASRFEHEVVGCRGLDDPNETVDRLLPELDRWTGQAYAELEGHRFEAERQRLNQLRMEGTERAQLALIALGRAEEGLPRLYERLNDQPLHEGLVEALMISLYLLGDQVEALEVFESTRRRLLEEHGLEPWPRLAAAHLAILRQDPVGGLTPNDAPSLGRPKIGLEVGVALGAGLTARPPLSLSSEVSVVEVLRQRADTQARLGHFAEAAEVYLRAVDVALQNGEVENAARLTLRLSRVAWEPQLGEQVASLIDRVALRLDDPLLGAAIRICRVGGLFRDGLESASVDERAALTLDLDEVRRRGSAFDIGWAITHFREALAGDLGTQESLALIQEVGDMELTDPLLKGQTERARFSDHLRAGQIGKARAALVAVGPKPRAHELAVNQMGWQAVRNCWNLACGRFDAAQAGLAELMNFRGRLGDYTLDQVALGQSLWLTRELGEPSAVEAHYRGAKAMAISHPLTPMWASAAAMLAADMEWYEEMVEILDDACERYDMSSLPRGSHRLPTLAMFSEAVGVAAEAGIRPKEGVAEDLRTQLVESLDVGVLGGWPAVYLGSKHRFLGFASLAVGDRESAAEHFRTAVTEDRWLPPLRARSLDGLARVVDGEEAQALRRQARTTRERLFTRIV